MASRLPLEVISNIFEQAHQDLIVIRKMVMVNRSWCSVGMPYLWKAPFSNGLELNLQNLYEIIPVYISLLDESSRNILDKSDIPKVNYKTPLYNYASFLRSFDMPCLNEISERWLLYGYAISEFRVEYNRKGNEDRDCCCENNDLVDDELGVIVEECMTYGRCMEDDTYINIDEDSETEESSSRTVTLVTEICKHLLKSSSKITHLSINGFISIHYKHLLNDLQNIQGASNCLVHLESLSLKQVHCEGLLSGIARFCRNISVLEIEDVRTSAESLRTHFPMIITNQHSLKRLVFCVSSSYDISSIMSALQSQSESLIELKFEHFTITDITTMEHLIRCNNLQKLDITTNLYYYPNIMLFEMLAACVFKDLRTLNLRFNYDSKEVQIAENLRIFIKNCGHKLKELDIEYHPYGENVQILRTLRNCPQLESLSFPLGGDEEIDEFLKLVAELKFLKKLVLGRARKEVEADEFFLDFVEIWKDSTISHLSTNWIISDSTLTEFLDDYIIPIRKFEYLCEEDLYLSHKGSLISYSHKLRQKGLIKTLSILPRFHYTFDGSAIRRINRVVFETFAY
ncbi:814_t:CDS:1 [Acaulospora morrowiae]|uniref:814_t:CDS:1 n=1 Tax=Acaulospora morrowiae TaxID=94023 RepID=A0A9N9FMC3_9GLOM|nr:814_t:CDS:1 [Acaulospora morrowiae]